MGKPSAHIAQAASFNFMLCLDAGHNLKCTISGNHLIMLLVVGFTGVLVMYLRTVFRQDIAYPAEIKGIGTVVCQYQKIAEGSRLFI